MIYKTLYGQTAGWFAQCGTAAVLSVQGGQTSAHCYTSPPWTSLHWCAFSQQWRYFQSLHQLSGCQVWANTCLTKCWHSPAPTKGISLTLSFMAPIYHRNSGVTRETRPQTAQLKESWPLSAFSVFWSFPATFRDDFAPWECGPIPHELWDFFLPINIFLLNAFSTSPFPRL